MATSYKLAITIRGYIEVNASSYEDACDRIERTSLDLVAKDMTDVEVELDYEDCPELEYEHEDKLERDLD